MLGVFLLGYFCVLLGYFCGFLNARHLSTLQNNVFASTLTVFSSLFSQCVPVPRESVKAQPPLSSSSDTLYTIRGLREARALARSRRGMPPTHFCPDERDCARLLPPTGIREMGSTGKKGRAGDSGAVSVSPQTRRNRSTAACRRRFVAHTRNLIPLILIFCNLDCLSCI